MNEVTYTATAEPAATPAGIYTATAGDARADRPAGQECCRRDQPEFQERPRGDRPDQRPATRLQGQRAPGPAAVATRAIRTVERGYLDVDVERHDGHRCAARLQPMTRLLGKRVIS